MIRRTFDVAYVNELLARNWEGIDFTGAISNPLNVCLLEDDSGAIFIWHGPDIYEIHLFYSVRGRAAIDLIQQMLTFMRREHGALFFWCAIPVESRHVRLIARLVGWKSKGILDAVLGPSEIFVSEELRCHL